MSEQFKGFSKQSLKFFSDLQKSNSKDWFTENRDVFDSEILLPAKAFVADMGNRLRKITPTILI